MSIDFSTLRGRVIEFTEEVEKSEIDFDQGCRARVVNAGYSDDDKVVVELMVDFKEFEESNKKFMRPTYYNMDGEARLYWYETPGYPKDCRETIFVDVSDFVTDKCPFIVISEDPIIKIKETAKSIRHELIPLLERAGFQCSGVVDSIIDEVVIKHLSQ